MEGDTGRREGGLQVSLLIANRNTGCFWVAVGEGRC